MTKHSPRNILIPFRYLAAAAVLLIPWTLRVDAAESIWSGTYTEAQAERGAADPP